MKADKVSAVFSIVVSNAGINAEEVGIRTVGTFSHGNTDPWHCDLAGIADYKEVFAFSIALAAFELVNSLKIAENAATHKNMRFFLRIILYFL